MRFDARNYGFLCKRNPSGDPKKNTLIREPPGPIPPVKEPSGRQKPPMKEPLSDHQEEAPPSIREPPKQRRAVCLSRKSLCNRMMKKS